MEPKSAQRDDSWSVFRTRAYAKVNLALSVGKAIEPGGFHPICSWMHAIDLCDEIEIHRVPDSQESSYAIGWAKLTGEDQAVDWLVDDDLGVRAHRLMQTHVGRQLPIQITISKSIPVGGGLGGGSSDAASVLMGLNTLFDLKLDHQTLVELAIRLGSDIPFFIDPEHQIPRPAIVQGLGDEITRVGTDHAGSVITLILPGFGCHTGEVYRAFDGLVDAGHILDTDRVRMMAESGSINDLQPFNDLESPARIVEPRLERVQDAISSAIDRVVHVSGSGSTVFVIGEIDPEMIKETYPECSVVCAHLI